jgi:tyrosinase
MPFWDWASSPDIPTIANTPSVTIMTPTGQKTVNNPLYQYTFPPLDPTYFPTNAPDGYLATDKTTIRDPNANAALSSAGLTAATVSSKGTICAIAELI